MTENPPTPEAGKDGKSLPVVDSPAAPPAIFPVESTHKTVELFTKIFVVVAAVLYVTGFLVVSLHLARYGVHSFSILRAQYILAGSWFFAHILFFVPIAIVPWLLIGLSKDKDKRRTNFVELGLSIAMAGMIYYGLFHFGISIFKFENITILASYSAITIQLLWGTCFLWIAFPKLRYRRIYISILVMVIFLIIIAYTFIFSIGVYSKISAEYGGGKPVKVQFHWKDECKTKDIAAAFKKECKLKEEPVVFDQILATDTDHVIISPCPKIYPRTFEISNDLIDYVEIKYGQ